MKKGRNMTEKQKVYSKKCKCALCGGPAVVESLLPIADEDEIGVVCEECVKAYKEVKEVK